MSQLVHAMFISNDRALLYRCKKKIKKSQNIMKMTVVAKLENLYDASKENQVNQMKENKQNKKTRIYFYNIELTPVKLNFLFFFFSC